MTYDLWFVVYGMLFMVGGLWFMICGLTTYGVWCVESSS